MRNSAVWTLCAALVTLTEAFASVQKADLASVLDHPGPITVFAPSSSAFDEMAEGHLQYLSSAEVRTLQKHVITALNIDLIEPFPLDVFYHDDPIKTTLILQGHNKLVELLRNHMVQSTAVSSAGMF